MTIFQCRQSEGFVLARVFLISYAYEGSLQKSHDCREHFSTRQTRQFHVLSDSPTDVRQGFGELSQSVKLIFVAHFAPTLVIAVLLAATRVATCCLNMTIWRGTDPDLCPRGGN